MFNLTSSWVCDNSISLSEQRILLILELQIILWVVYIQLYDGRFLFAGYYSGAFCT